MGRKGPLKKKSLPPRCECECARCDVGFHCARKDQGCQHPGWKDLNARPKPSESGS